MDAALVAVATVELTKACTVNLIKFREKVSEDIDASVSNINLIDPRADCLLINLQNRNFGDKLFTEIWKIQTSSRNDRFRNSVCNGITNLGDIKILTGTKL